MKDKKELIILISLFLLVLALRLSFTLSEPNFSDDTSYYNLKQIQNIFKQGIPASNIGNHFFITSAPLFYYLIAFFSLLIPIELVSKIVPQILASTLPIIIYFIVYKIVRNKKISYATAFIGGTIPIFLKTTTNTLLADTLAVPLFFLALYFLLDLNNKKNAYYFMTIAIALMLTNSLSILLVLSLLFYLIIIKSTHLKNKSKEFEITLFTSFIVIWFTVIIFKNAFLLHGYSTIWQNIPAQILQVYFAEISFLEAIYAIGIIPLVAGIIVIYKYLINRQKRSIYLFSSVIIISFILMWFRLIKSATALTILGISLIIISSQFYQDFLISFFKTKLPFKKKILIGLIILFLVVSIVPSLDNLQQAKESAFSEQEIDAIDWITKKTDKDSVIACMYNEGHIINYLSGRKTLINQNFLSFTESQQRLTAQNHIFSSSFVTNALRETTKYNIDYIYFSPKAKEYFMLGSIPYIDNECFEKEYNNEKVEIYRVRCII